MSVTVAVPSLGHSPGLVRCLRSVLAALDRMPEPGEVILVLNGTSKDAGRLGIEDPRLRVITDPVAGAARARNTAIDLAANDRVLFTDDDCEVPPGWCQELAAALNAAPAVAAPVVVPPAGPVPSFIDYKRTFVAPPVNESTVRCMVTASCGLRQSAVPPGLRFDDALFNQAAAEDSALSYRLADAGVSIRWIGSAAPARHHLRNAPAEIVERFLRYGAGNARLVNADGRWQESVPDAWSWLNSIRDGSCADHRRFPEIPTPAIRAFFVACELALTASWLAGYLTEMQDHLALQVVSVDRAALTAALDVIIGQAAADVASAGTWIMPEVDLARLTAPDGVGYESLRAALSEALRAAVRITGGPADVSRLTCHLIIHRGPVLREQARIRSRALGAWTRIAGDQQAMLDELEAQLRRGGVSLSDGLDEIEKAFSADRLA